jgi:2-oxoglutarate ferredoxin oxidoreductase subunit delta
MKFWRIPYDKEEVKIIKGKVHILRDRCKGCKFCVEYCPKNVLEMDTSFNVKGYHPPVVVNPEDCLDCGLCEMICPEFAIWSTPKE